MSDTDTPGLAAFRAWWEDNKIRVTAEGVSHVAAWVLWRCAWHASRDALAPVPEEKATGDLYQSMLTLQHRCGYIINMCKDTREMKLEAEEMLRVLRSLVIPSTHVHDWKPDGGVLKFESHPNGEAPHVHTTCAKCGARAWFLEYQWELLDTGCAVSPQRTTGE